MLTISPLTISPTLYFSGIDSQGFSTNCFNPSEILEVSLLKSIT